MKLDSALLRSVVRVTPLAALLLLLLPACPPDDDDSAEPTPPPDTGEAPVVGNVEVCEMAVVSQQCNPNGVPGVFELRFRISVTDEDGDLLNPDYHIRVDGESPYVEGWIEADMGDGGILAVDYCDEWERGATIGYEVWMTDDAENDSAIFEGSYLVPAEPGDDDCAPG